MARGLSIIILILLCYNLYAQTQTAAETVNKYSLAQKRLLVVNTTQFTNFITQNSLDRDSVMLIASRITGLPFLVAYSNEYNSGSSTVGDDLINAGKINEAIQLLKKVTADNQLQLLIKLAIWYLHKAGTHKTDLDSANYYIYKAISSGDTVRNKNFLYECRGLLGEYFRQLGNVTESKKIYLQMASSGKLKGDEIVAAGALHYLGKLSNETELKGLLYLDSALVVYRRLKMEEKEIEVLWDITTLHMRSDINAFRNDLVQILKVQQSLEYRHSLFADYLLSFADVQQAKFSDALAHANVALENMKWSGIVALEGSFYTRVGACYLFLGKTEEGIKWFDKALAHKSNDTHIYWYKALFWKAPELIDMNRTNDALSMLENIANEFPPLTPWEKSQVLVTKAHCYRELKNDKLVEETYRSFLRLLNEFPNLDPYGELRTDCKQMFDYYLSKSDLKTARLFAQRFLTTRNAAITSETFNNYLFYKLDSMEGKYKSALDHYIRYQFYTDSFKGIEQTKAFNELTLKYSAEKKDNEIKLLQKDKELLQKDKQLQGTMLKQEKYTRNWILGAMALLLAIVGLLVYNSRLKQRSNKELKVQQAEIGEQNSTLRHLVNEKEWLVKEIHHRVKNNLQTVMSLLGTQSGYLKNDIAIDAINDSQRRVQAMSLIHQKLYQSNHLSAIKMTDYIYELVDSLSDSFDIGKHIRFNMDIEPIELDISHCIPLGLILNEAITNSFKHAFPGDQQGIISISLKNISQNNFLLTIKDNGRGLPSGFNITRSDSMGVELMHGLSDDIGAQFSIFNEKGTRVDIRFAYDPDIDRDIIQNKTEIADTA